MSTEEKPQVLEEPQKTVPEESQQAVCEEQQSLQSNVAPAEVEEKPEGIESDEGKAVND